MELTRAVTAPPTAVRSLREHEVRTPRAHLVLDPLVVAFAASRLGFRVIETWDPLDVELPSLDDVLARAGSDARLVRLVVVDSRLVCIRRAEGPLGRRIPGRVLDAARRLVAVMDASDQLARIDLVLDGRGVWWFGGLSVEPRVTSRRRAPAAEW